MTKVDLIAVIADKLKFPWASAELLVDAVFGCLEQSMSRGEKIEVRATRPNYPYARHTCLSSRMRTKTGLSMLALGDGPRGDQPVSAL